MGKIRIYAGAVAVVAVTMLALAPVSYGLSSSVETYGGQGGNVAGSVASGTTGGPGATVSPTSACTGPSSVWDPDHWPRLELPGCSSRVDLHQ